MNIEQNLIIINNEDKTEEITHCSPITNGKRNITGKYDIPILRLATNGSGEEEKLENKLIQVLNINSI